MINKKDNNKEKKIELFLIMMLFLVMNSFYSISQPTTPINIDGFVFLDNGVGAPNGVPIIINNTNTNQIFKTSTYSTIPALQGFYSATINGNIGHEVIVRAYNETHYGETTKTLTTSTTQINVTMNNTRTPELIVNITSPEINGLISSNSDFNVTVNITSIIGNSNLCEATIYISNTAAMDVKNSYTNSISQILKDETITAIFELESYTFGSSNISVIVNCDNADIFFEGNNQDEVFNITVIDDQPPIITIVNPLNESIEKTSNEVTFTYIVNDDSAISECRLYINNSLENSSQNVIKNTEQNFTVTIANNFYEWEIQCDDPSLSGTSGIYYLSVEVYYPEIISVSLPEVINLNPGAQKEVTCNVTVKDMNGAEDIVNVTANLHLENISQQIENNNYFYFGNCNKVGELGDEVTYSCLYNLEYYANNGTWICNATSEDVQGLTHNNFNTTIVDTLYAINLSSLIIEYGDVPAGSISTEQAINIINIGNMPTNVYVRGYGGSDPLIGDGLSMICDNSQNISVNNQKFSITQNTLFNNKEELSSSFKEIINELNKQTNINPVSIMSYWEIMAPPMDVTSCEGTIVFSVTN